MTHLNIAIPSKGRLKEKTEEWLSRSGFQLKQVGGGRGYTASLKGLPEANVMLLSASEIAKGLIAGSLHIGVTGEDLIHEYSADVASDTSVLRRLGFGHADVIVAVPQSWLDVDTMADLEAAGAQFRDAHKRRLRVATKFLNLTRRFFAERAVGEYRLVESAGATEAAPAAGTAELIVDITSTGSTLRANDLKILSDGVILKSQAALVGSQRADWSSQAQETLRRLLDSIEATAASDKVRRIETEQPIPADLADQLGLRILQGGGVLCPAESASEVARTLAGHGLGCVTIATVEQVFHSDNAIYSDFIKSVSLPA